MCAKFEANKYLFKENPNYCSNSSSKRNPLAYLIRGSIVIAQTIAEMPPITSSSEGTDPDAGQMPLRVYNGEVPRSAYMIPIRDRLP
jgi:hypothetical protein